MDVSTVVFVALAFVLGLFVNSLRSYFSKKGENLATKEDLAALTRIAKEIEAKISDDAWSRQRRWELKKQVMFEALGLFSTIQWSIRVMDAARRVGNEAADDGAKIKALAYHNKELEQFKDSVRSLNRPLFLMMATCDKAVRDSLVAANKGLSELAQKMLVENVNQDEVQAAASALNGKIDAAAKAIRAELGFVES